MFFLCLIIWGFSGGWGCLLFVVLRSHFVTKSYQDVSLVFPLYDLYDNMIIYEFYNYMMILESLLI